MLTSFSLLIETIDKIVKSKLFYMSIIDGPNLIVNVKSREYSMLNMIIQEPFVRESQENYEKKYFVCAIYFTMIK